MVAVPAAFPVTVPPLTVATLVLLLLQVTVLSVALLGEMVAVSLYVFPTSIVVLVVFRLIPVTATVGFFTVTLQVAVLPLPVFAVMVAVPTAFPLTVPPLTIATLVLLLLQVTVLSVALLGLMVAVSLAVFPFSIVTLLLSNVILVGSTFISLVRSGMPYP